MPRMSKYEADTLRQFQVHGSIDLERQYVGYLDEDGYITADEKVPHLYHVTPAGLAFDTLPIRRPAIRQNEILRGLASGLSLIKPVRWTIWVMRDGDRYFNQRTDTVDRLEDRDLLEKSWNPDLVATQCTLTERGWQLARDLGLAPVAELVAESAGPTP